MKRSLLVITTALSLLLALFIGGTAAQAAPKNCMPKGDTTKTAPFSCDAAPTRDMATAATKTPKTPKCGSKSGETFLRTG